MDLKNNKTKKEKQIKGNSKLKDIFGKKRIVGLAGNKNTGKTNNLIHLIKNLRKHNKEVKIFAYGLPKDLKDCMKNNKIKEISSLKQLISKKDCILIIDEFQRLKLNDRRYKDQLMEFIDFVYHRNVYVIFSSPNIREFNSIIGGIIEVWLLKSINTDQTVRGSQLKRVIEEYSGKYKLLGCIDTPKGEMLLINDIEEIIIKCPYEEEADHKKEHISLL